MYVSQLSAYEFNVYVYKLLLVSSMYKCIRTYTSRTYKLSTCVLPYKLLNFFQLEEERELNFLRGRLSDSAWRSRLSSSAGSQRSNQRSNSPALWLVAGNQSSPAAARTSISQPSYPARTRHVPSNLTALLQHCPRQTTAQQSSSGGEQLPPAAGTGQEQRHPAVVLETITETDMEALSVRSRGGMCPEEGGHEVVGATQEKESAEEKPSRSKIAEWMEDFDVAAYNKPRVLITSNAPPALPVKPSTADQM